MSYAGDLARVVRGARRDGFRVERTGRGHYRFLAPDGKTSVTTSGTPSDRRAWRNFMSDLKKAANGAATTNLGDALASAMSKKNDPPPPPMSTGDLPRGEESERSVPTIIREILGKRNGGMGFTDIVMAVRSRRPDAKKESISSALNTMKMRGELVQPERGFYKPKTAIPVPPVAQVAKEVTPPPSITLPTNLAEDERILDEALVALSKIESVVRRNKALLKKLGEVSTIFSRVSFEEGK